jgi:hypothetical protein
VNPFPPHPFRAVGRRKDNDCACATPAALRRWLPISCTTRPPRPTEATGQDYHFLTRMSSAPARSGDFAVGGGPRQPVRNVTERGRKDP